MDEGYYGYLQLVLFLAAIALPAWLIVHGLYFRTKLVSAGDALRGQLPKPKEKSIDIVNELNKFLIAMGTLYFVGFGWLISDYPDASAHWMIRCALFSALGLTVFMFFSGVRVYVELVSQLGSDTINLTHPASRLLFWAELQFLAAFQAGTLLLSTLIVAIVR